MNSVRQFGRSAVHCAVVSCNSDAIRVLVEHGADVNLQNKVRCLVDVPG